MIKWWFKEVYVGFPTKNEDCSDGRMFPSEARRARVRRDSSSRTCAARSLTRGRRAARCALARARPRTARRRANAAFRTARH